jgi:hypothetical protein
VTFAFDGADGTGWRAAALTQRWLVMSQNGWLAVMTDYG